MPPLFKYGLFYTSLYACIDHTCILYGNFPYNKLLSLFVAEEVK